MEKRVMDLLMDETVPIHNRIPMIEHSLRQIFEDSTAPAIERGWAIATFETLQHLRRVKSESIRRKTGASPSERSICIAICEDVARRVYAKQN